MDLGSLFIFLALLILVGLYVSRPFFESKSMSEVNLDSVHPNKTPVNAEDEHQLSALMAERDRILLAIQELDFDATLGKIPEEDYPSQRQALLSKGAEVLRQLDAYQVEMPVAMSLADEHQSEPSAAGQQAVSPGIAVVGYGNGNRASVFGDDEIETLLANRRRERQGKASGFCPKCGGALQKVDKFCPKCGARVS